MVKDQPDAAAKDSDDGHSGAVKPASRHVNPSAFLDVFATPPAEASPHRRVALMLVGARNRLQQAARFIEAGDREGGDEALLAASTLIGELDSSLDRSGGSDPANGLAALYRYAQRRLLDSHANADAAPLQEVDELLSGIESAWNALPDADPAAA